MSDESNAEDSMLAAAERYENQSEVEICGTCAHYASLGACGLKNYTGMCLRDRDADGVSDPERANPEDDACDAWARGE